MILDINQLENCNLKNLLLRFMSVRLQGGKSFYLPFPVPIAGEKRELLLHCYM